MSLDKIGIFDIRPTIESDYIDIGTDIVQEGINVHGVLDMIKNVISEAYTASVDGRIQGIGGFIILWDGVAECFSIWTKECTRKYKLAMVRGTRAINKMFCEKRKIWRLQATIADNIPASWVKHIGFEYEGTLRNYSMAGTDVLIFSQLHPENLRH
jgi:predicted acetyltransferase